MNVRPITKNAADCWLAATHRHLKRPPTGWLFGVKVLDDSEVMIGMACAARPAARLLQDGATCEITRVAIAPGNPEGCSFAYGALRRAAAALGYQRVYTYTRADETGGSVRGAGFVQDSPVGGGRWRRS